VLYQFPKVVLHLVKFVFEVSTQTEAGKMSGVVKIEIRETEEELKALLGREKDAHRHEKLQVLYWLKTQTVETVLSAAVRRRETSYHGTKMVV